MEPLDFFGAYYRGTQAVQCKLCGSEIAESCYYRISGYNVCEAHYNEWYRRVENAKSRVADQFAEALRECANEGMMELKEIIQRSKSRPEIYAPALAMEALRLSAELAECRQQNTLLRKALEDATERMDRARGVIRTPHGVGWAMLDTTTQYAALAADGEAK